MVSGSAKAFSTSAWVAGQVFLQGQEVISALAADGAGDLGLRAHGVDGHEGALQSQALEQARDGGDLVRLVGSRLLAEHQALAAGPGRDEVKRLAALGAVVSASGGLAINGDDFRTVGFARGGAQGLDPTEEALLEQLRVEGVHDIAQGVVAGQAVLIGQEATQERQGLLAPQADRHEVVGAGQRGAQHEQQDLGQQVEHLAALTRVPQGGKVIEQ